MKTSNSFNKFLFLIFLFSVSSSSEIQSQQLSSQKLDLVVEKAMKVFEVPGVSVAVVKNGKVIHSKGYGVRSLNSSEKVDEHTLFAIASNSKAFTSATLGLLVDEGKINWDDKVVKYIPEFRLYDSYVTQEFTIRDLITHRSGLGLGAGDLMFFPDSNDFTLSEIIYNLRYLKPVSSFRSKYDYDNLLYLVAGKIVAQVSGKSWEEFVEEKIMKPLGMNESAGNFNRLNNFSNVASPHAPEFGVTGNVKVIDRYDFNSIGSAGGIYSNINDMCKWVTMHLNEAKFGENLNKQLLSTKTHNEMWKSQTIIPIPRKDHYKTNFRAYGLGWFLQDINGNLQVTHTGGLPGMVTQVILMPEMELGIIILTNQQSGAAFKSISNYILDFYLELPETDHVKILSERIKSEIKEAEKITSEIWKNIDEERKKSSSKKIDFNTYTGTFKDNWFGEVSISINNQKMYFNSKRSPKLNGEIFFYKGNTFIVKWDDQTMDANAYLLYNLDFEGKPIGIKMKAISPLTDFSYDFHDLEFYRVKD